MPGSRPVTGDAALGTQSPCCRTGHPNPVPCPLWQPWVGGGGREKSGSGTDQVPSVRGLL